MASSMATVEPLPLVPATVITGAESAVCIPFQTWRTRARPRSMCASEERFSKSASQAAKSRSGSRAEPGPGSEPGSESEQCTATRRSSVCILSFFFARIRFFICPGWRGRFPGAALHRHFAVITSGLLCIVFSGRSALLTGAVVVRIGHCRPRIVRHVLLPGVSGSGAVVLISVLAGISTCKQVTFNFDAAAPRRHQHDQQPVNARAQLAAIDDLDDNAFFKQKLGALEALGQLFANGLLNHARAGKADQCIGLGQMDVTQHAQAG